MPLTVGIHQPNYLPWLGYFYKIAQCDKFVVLDEVQYPKGSVSNRNLVQGTNQDPVLLTVPISHTNGSFQTYLNTLIDNQKPWAEKHLKTIFYGYNKTPHFKVIYEALELLLKKKYTNIGELNITLIQWAMQQMKIETELFFFSEMKIDATEKNDRIIKICQKLQADTYRPGKGGLSYQDDQLFEASGIKIAPLNFKHPEYNQGKSSFSPNLSFIDAFFHIGPAETKKLITP